MKTLLLKAFKELSKLPKSMQDEIASELLEDIESELKWNKALAESQDKSCLRQIRYGELKKLADKALEDFKAGRTNRYS